MRSIFYAFVQLTPACASVRMLLFRACKTFNDMLDENNICYIHINSPSQCSVDLMKAYDVGIVNSVANFVWDAFKIRERLLVELQC